MNWDRCHEICTIGWLGRPRIREFIDSLTTLSALCASVSLVIAAENFFEGSLRSLTFELVAPKEEDTCAYYLP